MPQLADVDVEFVSLVDRAAVRDPVNRKEPNRFLLWKRDTTSQGGPMTTLTKELLDQLGDPVAKEDELKGYVTKADGSDEVAAALTGAARLLAAHKADLPHDALLELAKASGIDLRLEKAGPKFGTPEWDEKYGTGAKKPEPKTAAELVESLKKSDMDSAIVDQVESALAKAAEADDLAKADPAMRARIEKAEGETKEALDIAKAERDTRLTKEFITKAEKLDGLTIKAEDFGPILKSASEKLDKAEFEALETVLKASSEQIKKGDLFTEAGAGGVPPAGSALEEVTNKAAESARPTRRSPSRSRWTRPCPPTATSKPATSPSSARSAADGEGEPTPWLPRRSTRMISKPQPLPRTCRRSSSRWSS